ncbi:MAG: hypothetical protein WDW38_005852 [Sanguina aurantia]
MLSTRTAPSLKAPSLIKPSFVARKLFASFKRAAWITSTSLLILLVPLIIEMDREQQMMDMEKEQLNVLTGPAGAALNKA